MHPHRALALAAVAVVLALGGCASEPAESPLDPAQQVELNTLRAQLLEPGRQEQTRYESARMLISRDWPQADRLLVQALADASSPAAQVAVAQAIAQDLPRNRGFIEPLQALLGDSQQAVRSATALALASYQDPAATRVLLGMARDRSAPVPVRLTSIGALGGVLSRESVDVLLDCLADPSPAIRRQAATTLEQLTGQQGLGTNQHAWQRWWSANRDKPRSAWLEEMVLHLTRSQRRIQRQNDILQQRLGRAMEELYNASATSQKPVILLTMMKDPVAEIRLRGVSLAEQLFTAEGSLDESLLQHVRLLMEDGDPRIRRASVVLLTAAGVGELDELISQRLAVETEPEVRAELLTSLGQQGHAESLPILGQALSSDATLEAIAAARAIAKLASAHSLDAEQKRETLDALLGRYRRSSTGADSLLETLLTAMAAIGDGSDLVTIFVEALGDDSGLIRLAAVNGLARLDATAVADALVPMLQDSDRGVRHATIQAVVTLGQARFLANILQRMDPHIEPDSAVQKAAAEACLTLADQASPRALGEALELLESPRSALQREVAIALRERLIRQVPPEDYPARIAMTRRQAASLIEAGREDEAVAVLADLLETLPTHQGDDASPNPSELFLEYVAALLAANDTKVGSVLASQGDEGLYRVAVREVQGRLSELIRQQEYARAVQLASAVLDANAQQLTADQARSIRELRTQARNEQLQVDRRQVTRLTARLLSGDPTAQAEARTQLQAMGDRAVEPLLRELQQLVRAEPADPQAEQRLFDVLKQLAPSLGEYAPSAPQEQKLARIRSWLK